MVSAKAIRNTLNSSKSGVLIEAESNNFRLCRRYRARRTKVYKAACVSFAYPKIKLK